MLDFFNAVLSYQALKGQVCKCYFKSLPSLHPYATSWHHRLIDMLMRSVSRFRAAVFMEMAVDMLLLLLEVQLLILAAEP